MESLTTEKWIKLMRLGRLTGCHQMPERSFFIREYQFPICARCSGMLVGEIIAYIFLFAFKLLLSPFNAVLFLTVMFSDWLIQFLKIRQSTNLRRFITGILGGIGITALFVRLIIKCISKLKGISKN